jgi:thiamine pyrophosphate-dependent acetolactate synthase large subunit-like protein
MWAAQFYKFTKPRTIISSGGLGTMGYGFPAAIGAQLGVPGATVIDIAGDGSIQMNIQEQNCSNAKTANLSLCDILIANQLFLNTATSSIDT